MDKVQKLNHSLYDIKMKLIDLEFREKAKGLGKKQQEELEILRKRKTELEGKIARMKK